MRGYNLVYQCGLANVFRHEKTESEGASWRYTRLVQGTYETAERYCCGLLEAGASVSVWHSDVAGDCLVMQPWREGAGELWAERKTPPKGASYSDS